jgi:hypothetical protein
MKNAQNTLKAGALDVDVQPKKFFAARDSQSVVRSEAATGKVTTGSAGSARPLSSRHTHVSTIKVEKSQILR